MSLACYVCTYIFVGKILKTMGDCCKEIFKLVMNDWSLVLMVLSLHRLVPIYLPTFNFFFFNVFAIELTKCKSQNEKEIMSCKSLSHMLVFDYEKGKVTFVLKCMVLKKPKANSQCWNIKNFKHRSQKKMYYPKRIKYYDLCRSQMKSF